METKTKIIIATISLITAFAFGRYSVPERVKIETKIVEVEKKTSDKNSEAERNKKKTTETKETVKPDGTRETTTKTTEETEVSKKNNEHSTDETSKNSESSKEVISGQSKTSLNVLAGVKANDITGGLIYGVSVTKPILGPISIGIWGLTNSTIGASVGLLF